MEDLKGNLNEELARRIMAGEIPSDITIREGEALPLQEPEKVRLKGQITAPALWLEKRVDTIEQKQAFVLISREGFLITLRIDETNHYFTEISGKLELSDEMKKFAINTGEYIGAFDMADKIKAYRSYFTSQADAMKLVAELRNFKAKIDKEIEASDDKRGNARFLRSQIVESNLPKSFKLEIPIFKGQPKKTIEVEVEINPDNLQCTLVSPEANDTVLQERDNIMNDEISKIKETAPDIVIIEQ